MNLEDRLESIRARHYELSDEIDREDEKLEDLTNRLNWILNAEFSQEELEALKEYRLI